MIIPKIIFDRVDEYNWEGQIELDVRAKGIQVGRLVLEQAHANKSRVVDWRWDGDFPPNDNWLCEDNEIRESQDMFELIARAVRGSVAQIA